MSIEENIKKLIEQRFETVKSFSEYIELPYTTVRSILQRGVLNSKLENVIKISDGLKMQPEELLKLDDERPELSINTIYSKLQPLRQQKVYDFAEYQLKQQNKKQTVQVIGQTAAGEPLSYGDSIVEEKEVSYIPKGAECALNVKGDSMESEFPDGSIVFYKKQSSVENGDIAIVEVEGDGVTCKKIKFDYDNKNIILQSLNEKYNDIVLKDNQVKIIGKVVK